MSAHTKISISRRQLLKYGLVSGVPSMLSQSNMRPVFGDNTHNQRADKNSKSPNILVFFCDQLRHDLLGCYGGKIVRTPNIDALASESAVFDHAYTPCALCSPARASLMTGLYPHLHHMFNNSTPGYSFCEHLRSDIQTLADWTKKNTDYQTAYFGKWHIGPAADLFNSAFDKTHPKPSEGSLPYLGSSHWHPTKALGPMVQSFADGSAGTIDVPMDKFPDAAAANFTKQFLNNQKANAKPFLAFCSFPGPHSPWLLPEEFGIRYNPDDILLWPNRHDTFECKPMNQKKLRLLKTTDENYTSPAQKDKELKELLACNFSYIELIDTMVGEVVTELKKTGQYDNTMIVLTADHGDMAGAHGFLSKGSYMYDEIYRIPLIIKSANATKSKRFSEPVHLMDVTATMMHAMKDEPVNRMSTHELQGQSLIPLIRGTKKWGRVVHYAQYHGDWYGHYSARMVTDGRWKLVWNLSDFCELYDLKNDPGELKNLFYEESYRKTCDRYFDILVTEAGRLKDQQLRWHRPGVERRLPLNLHQGINENRSGDV